MGNVVDLRQRREQKAAEEHSRALVVFEYAALLARQRNPALLRLIDDVFGAGEVERRVQDTLAPREVTTAQSFASRRRAPLSPSAV
jgi:hypothetical protein